jgi:leucine dehydrogenase
VLLDFADTVDALGGAYLTAEDVGTSEPDMRVISEGTPHVSGLPEDRGGSGDPSPWTALGVEAAIRVACERVFGSDALEGRRVSVVGLGHVGGPLAELLAAAGAELVVADIDPGRRQLAERIGAEWVDTATALTADVDVLAPCALGGVLDARTVPALRCRAIAGAANNQLADEGIGTQLAARGILWVPDFVANAGGVINISVEFEDGGYRRDRADAKVRGVADTVRTVLDHADANATTPLAAALDIARRRVDEARAAPAA